MTDFNLDELFDMAEKARKQAYSPYSGYSVGAALLCSSGKVYTGCNIENSAFSPTVCAERVSFFKAISEGERDFCAIAVAGGKKDCETCTPCGVCRQVMMEFCNPEDFLIVYKENNDLKKIKLNEFLPFAFGPSNVR